MAVCALLSSLMACAQLLPLPSIQLWPLSSQVPVGYWKPSLHSQKKSFFTRAKCPSPLPPARCPLVVKHAGFSLEAGGNGKGGKKGLFLLPGQSWVCTNAMKQSW